MTPSLFESRPEFRYQAGFGPYMDKNHENWKFVDVPEHLALSDTAQAARREAGAESAQMFTMLGGKRVIWYFSSRDRDGGGMSYSIETPKDATRAWARITALEYVTELEVTLYIAENMIERATYTVLRRNG